MVVAGGLSCSVVFAQYQTSPSDTNKPKTGTSDTEKQMSALRTYDEILKDANMGKSITDEEAVTLVQNAKFMDSLEKNPNLADQVAKHPYAASLFYEMQGFKQWSETNPDKAKLVMDAAMKWQSMSAEDKDKFFRKNPTLKEGQGGSMQGGSGAPDKATKEDSMQGGTTQQLKIGATDQMKHKQDMKKKKMNGGAY